jgi:hypothetical protein
VCSRPRIVNSYITRPHPVGGLIGGGGGFCRSKPSYLHVDSCHSPDDGIIRGDNGSCSEFRFEYKGLGAPCKVRPPPSPVEVQEWPCEHSVRLGGPPFSPGMISVSVVSKVVRGPVTHDPRSGIRRNIRSAKSVRAAILAHWRLSEQGWGLHNPVGHPLLLLIP